MRKVCRTICFLLASYVLFSICGLCHGQSPEEKRVFRESFSKATTVTERRRLANALIDNHRPEIKKSFNGFSGAGWNGALRAPGFEKMLTNCVGKNPKKHGFILEVQAARDISSAGFRIDSCNARIVTNNSSADFDILATDPSTGQQFNFEMKDWQKKSFTKNNVAKLLGQLKRQKAAKPNSIHILFFRRGEKQIPQWVRNEIDDLGFRIVARQDSPKRASRLLSEIRTANAKWQAAIESSAARHSRTVRASPRGKSPPKSKNPRSNSVGGRLSRTRSAMVVASAFSGAINGYGVIEGETNILDATRNIAEDTALVGASIIIAEGILEQFGRGWVLTVPFMRNAEFGVATFVFDGVTVLCAYTKGDISEEEVLKRTSESAVSALVAGTAHYVAVLLAPTAFGGFVPVAVGIGTYLCVAKAFDMYEEYSSRKYLNRGDILGKLPASIRYRLTLFDEGRQENLFSTRPGNTTLSPKPKHSLIDPPPKKTLLD